MFLSGQILLLHLVEGASGQERRNAVWETEKRKETVCGKFKNPIFSGSHGRCPDEVVEG